MFTQILKRNTGNAEQNLFELDKPFKGYNQVIVSVKLDGVSGLMGSYFIHGTKDGDKTDKELTWDMGREDFVAEEVLKQLLTV